jgi:hypothetical protein
VTLSGTVDTDAQREAAAKYAAAEPGVKQVINNLQVTPMAAATEPAPAPSPEPEAAPVRSSKSSRPSPASKAAHKRSTSQDEMSQPARAEQPAASTPAQAPMAAPQIASAPPPPPEPRKVTVPSGTALPVRLIDAIDSATAQTGDTFHATLDAPVAVDGDVVIPAHYDVEGHVVNAQASGKFAGRALLTLQLDRIKVGDRYYNIQTDQFSQQTGSRGKNTAAKVGGGAVAAIGSVAGAGAGGGVQAASKKPDIKLSSEKVLTFTLQAPVTVTPTTKPAREGTRLDTNSAQ